jgi:hypothetical protein
VKISYTMWGFGMYLMHLADYLTRRKYDKEKGREPKQQLAYRDKCRVCRKGFSSKIELDNQMKKKHPNSL